MVRNLVYNLHINGNNLIIINLYLIRLILYYFKNRVSNKIMNFHKNFHAFDLILILKNNFYCLFDFCKNLIKIFVLVLILIDFYSLFFLGIENFKINL